MRLAEKAYDHIKNLLLAGGVRADDWLPIEDIAQQLGASRQPVMDAMKRLKLEGFIDIVPQVGCRVRSPSVQEIDDFFRLFASGEALVAELAATRAEPADILGLQLISTQIGALAGSNQPAARQGESYRQLNRQLHAEMRRISRSPLLTDVVESLGDRSDFYVALSSQPVFALNIPQAHQEHEAIIAAIAAKKPDKARKAMEQHTAATEKRVLGELNRQAV